MARALEPISAPTTVLPAVNNTHTAGSILDAWRSEEEPVHSTPTSAATSSMFAEVAAATFGRAAMPIRWTLMVLVPQALFSIVRG